MKIHGKTSDNTLGNAFKEEGYNQYLMNDYEATISSNKLNSSNITHMLDMLDKEIIFTGRTNFNIYSSKKLWEDFGVFCKSLHMPICEVHDKIILYAMMKIPVRHILLDMTFQTRDNNATQKEVKEKILRRKLKSAMDKVLDLTQQDILDKNPRVYKMFEDLMDHAADFKNPSVELIELLEQGKVLL